MTIHKTLMYVAFGWLTLSGAAHYAIDVVSQYLRGKRAPGVEATLYYGLHTAYALALVLFGILGLLVARRAPQLLGQWPALLFCGVATAAWLAFGFAFIEYREPKIMLAIFAALFLAMALTR